MAAAMSVEELERQTGVPLADLEAWARLGLLRRDADGAYSTDALQRVRLVRYAQRRGVTAEMIAASWAHERDILGWYVEQLGGLDPSRGVRIDDAAREVGLDRARFQRFWTAFGLADQSEVVAEDLDAMRSVAMVLSLGFPEDALLQLVRVFADATGRIAEAAIRTFHFHVHEELRRQGLAGAELIEATRARGDPMELLVEPTLLYFHRKAWERAVLDDMVLHLAEELAPPGEQVGETSAAVLFVDLAGFTPLTEAMGDTVAASVLDRFSELVRVAATEHTGRIVKQIGDEFMLVFTEAGAAVAFGREICRLVAAEPQFPTLRLGAHVGTVLYREGDYSGANVNTAARVAAEARRGQFLVTDAVRSAASASASFVALGSRRLKGLTEDVSLYEVRVDNRGGDRVTDPVCGMELAPDDAHTRLSWHGTVLFFCTEQCLERFVAAPERYRIS
jgi:adenylate cyclase